MVATIDKSGRPETSVRATVAAALLPLLAMASVLLVVLA